MKSVSKLKALRKQILLMKKVTIPGTVSINLKKKKKFSIMVYRTNISLAENGPDLDKTSLTFKYSQLYFVFNGILMFLLIYSIIPDL